MKKKQGYSWRSTQETSIVLFALTDYLKMTKELDPDYSVKIFLNGKEVSQKVLIRLISTSNPKL